MTRYPKQGKGRRWTVVELKAISPEWHGDTLADGDGLSGEVRRSADGNIAVRWKYAFRWNDKVSWYQAGTWPLSNLEDVRRRRDEARRLVSEKVNPNTQKQADRIEAQRRAEAVLQGETERKAQDATVQEMFDVWIRDGVKRGDGNAHIRRSFEKDVLPLVGTKPVRLVTDSDLRDVLRALVDRGVNRTAELTCDDIQQMFRWSEMRQPWRRLLVDGNPAALLEIKRIVAIGHVIKKKRERWLKPHELQELAGIFADMESTYEAAQVGQKYDVPRPIPKTAQLATWICLGTLTRIGETLMGEWKHVDFAERTWFLPKENVKGEEDKKKDLTVQLSDFALRQFRALHARTGHTDWMFPSQNAKSHVDIKSATKLIGSRQVRFKKRSSKLTNRREDNSLVLAKGANGKWTEHDMRRTGATMMQQLRVLRHVIDLCQNHAVGTEVQQSYLLHDDSDQMTEAWANLGNRLDAIMDSEAAKRAQEGKAPLAAHLLPPPKAPARKRPKPR